MVPCQSLFEFNINTLMQHDDLSNLKMYIKLTNNLKKRIRQVCKVSKELFEVNSDFAAIFYDGFTAIQAEVKKACEDNKTHTDYQQFIETVSEYNAKLSEVYYEFRKEDIDNTIKMFQSPLTTEQVAALKRIETELQNKRGFGNLLVNKCSFYLDRLYSPNPPPLEILNASETFTLHTYKQRLLLPQHHNIICNHIFSSDHVR